MPYTRKRARRSRAYRSYRRRYYRYARKSRIPKAIGTSSANYLTACFTVNQQACIEIPTRSRFAISYLCFSPFASRFLQPFILTYMQDWAGAFGLYNSYSFRKYITMYQQMKIRGVYITITIPAHQTCVNTGLNIYFVWDRQTSVQQAAKYKSTYTSSGWATDLRQQCCDQGIKPKRILPGKGAISVRSKCLAKSLLEKTGWIDTATYYHESTVTYQGENWYTNDFQLQYWRDNQTLNCFSPMCWAFVEANDYNGTENSIYIPIEVQMRAYCDFRSPGASLDTTQTKNLLLKPNSDLWCHTIIGDKNPRDWDINPGPPIDTIDPFLGTKRTREPDETDMNAQPAVKAVKAVEHEELSDEDTPTQIL